MKYDVCDFVGFSLVPAEEKFHVPYFRTIYREPLGKLIEGDPQYLDDKPSEAMAWFNIACEAQKQLLRFTKEKSS
jgi:hypothetical protein